MDKKTLAEQLHALQKSQSEALAAHLQGKKTGLMMLMIGIALLFGGLILMIVIKPSMFLVSVIGIVVAIIGRNKRNKARSAENAINNDVDDLYRNIVSEAVAEEFGGSFDGYIACERVNETVTDYHVRSGLASYYAGTTTKFSTEGSNYSAFSGSYRNIPFKVQITYRTVIAKQSSKNAPDAVILESYCTPREVVLDAAVNTGLPFSIQYGNDMAEYSGEKLSKLKHLDKAAKKLSVSASDQSAAQLINGDVLTRITAAMSPDAKEGGVYGQLIKPDGIITRLNNGFFFISMAKGNALGCAERDIDRICSAIRNAIDTALYVSSQN